MNDTELRDLLIRIDVRTQATDVKVEDLADKLDNQYVRKETHDAQLHAHVTWLKYLTGSLGAVSLVFVAAIVGYFLDKI